MHGEGGGFERAAVDDPFVVAFDVDSEVTLDLSLGWAPEGGRGEREVEREVERRQVAWLKRGGQGVSIKGFGGKRTTVDVERRSPALLLVKLVLHVFRKLLELALALSIVGVDDEVPMQCELRFSGCLRCSR